MRRRVAVLALGVLALTACAPADTPAGPSPTADTPATPSASPTVGVCTVNLPDQWNQAIRDGRAPERDQMTSRVLTVSADGSMLVTLTAADPSGPSPQTPGSPTAQPPTPGPSAPQSPGPSAPQSPGPSAPRSPGTSPPGSQAPGPATPSAVPAASRQARPAEHPQDQPPSTPGDQGADRPAELWYFERGFANPVKVMTAPDANQRFLNADFDGRYFVFQVGVSIERGASIYAWDAFGQEPPEQVTTNNQGLLTPPMVDQGLVVWGQTAADGHDGAVVRYQLATRSRGIIERTYFGPGTYPRRSGSTITWADDRGRFRSIDMHGGTDVKVPATVAEQREVREFSSYRDLWMWTTAEQRVVTWHAAWSKPTVVTAAEGVRHPSVGDNYATFETSDQVRLWDSRAQSTAVLVPAPGRAELFGPWLVVTTSEGASVVNTRRLPPLLPC